LRSKPPRPLDPRNAEIASLIAVVLAVFIPLSALEGIPDPLGNTVFSIGGRSGAVPVGLGFSVIAILLYLLRRANRRWQQILSFLGGIFLGLIPWLFYFSLRSQWTSLAPLSALAVRGLIGGTLLGLIAWWYIPYTAWMRFKDSKELK
jgi:hypothetical protein